MNVLELKGDVLDLLGQVKKESTWERLREAIARELKREAAESDWWDDLTPEQQADLDLALIEIEDEANLVSHEDAMKLFAKSLES